jgi:uncharacterized membrane protein YfbV (UPF0208 family)
MQRSLIAALVALTFASAGITHAGEFSITPVRLDLPVRHGPNCCR